VSLGLIPVYSGNFTLSSAIEVEKVSLELRETLTFGLGFTRGGFEEDPVGTLRVNRRVLLLDCADQVAMDNLAQQESLEHDQKNSLFEGSESLLSSVTKKQTLGHRKHFVEDLPLGAEVSSKSCMPCSLNRRRA